jgi:hypothetical protein
VLLLEVIACLPSSALPFRSASHIHAHGNRAAFEPPDSRSAIVPPLLLLLMPLLLLLYVWV